MFAKNELRGSLRFTNGMLLSIVVSFLFLATFRMSSSVPPFTAATSLVALASQSMRDGDAKRLSLSLFPGVSGAEPSAYLTL